jgi:hypothetical protein
MALLLNILWFVLGGLVMGLAWWLVGLICALTKAARNSWELPISQVQLLVGVKPRCATFSRYGISFRPSGRHGQETSWRVGGAVGPTEIPFLAVTARCQLRRRPPI